MSRDSHKDYYNRDRRDSRDRDRRDPRDMNMRHRLRDERDYRNYDKHRKRSPTREDGRRSRSPKKDFLDDNIMREIAKLPEPNELWAPHNSGAPPPPGTGFSVVSFYFYVNFYTVSWVTTVPASKSDPKFKLNLPTQEKPSILNSNSEVIHESTFYNVPIYKNHHYHVHC